MKKMFFLGMTVLILSMLVIGCGDDETENNNTNTGISYWTWVHNSVNSSLTLNFEELENGVVKTTVSGTPTSIDNRWKAILDFNNYDLTLQNGKYYEYKIEMWTESGTRNINIQYYKDDASDTYLHFDNIALTNTRKEFEFTTPDPYLKSKTAYLGFQCADTIGVFYIKVISINETGAP